MGLLTALVGAGGAHAQTVLWEDYRGNDRVGTLYTGPAGRPVFANNTGTGAQRLDALRAISANSANAVRTGGATQIDYRQTAQNLCNLDAPVASATSCGLQAMGRVSYALIQFPAAGNYTLQVAHDDNVEVGFSSDYANTAYRGASYDVPVGSVANWTAGEDTYASIGSFQAANANSCALIRMYWLNHGGINFARLRWTRPGGVTEIIPATAFRNPSLSASAIGCNGSITGNGTVITLNKTLPAPRADANDQFNVQIATAATGGTVLREATTTGAGVGQQASTGALAVTTGTTYHLRETMASGSASTLAGAYTTAIGCTRNGTAFTPAGTAPAWNVTAAANDQIVCTISNTARPILRLRKQFPNGRLQTGDQFLLSIAPPVGAAATATTTGATNTPAEVASVAPATVGTSYTVSEAPAGTALAADYTSSYSCTNLRVGGVAPTGSGASFNFTPAAGDQLDCTFSNARIPRAALSIAKSASSTTTVTGSLLNYTIQVSNAGPSAADGSVLRDTPGVGLDCSTPGTPATCTAANGAQCPVAPIAIANLTGAPGVVVPLLPSTGSVTLSFQCRVTASGQS